MDIDDIFVGISRLTKEFHSAVKILQIFFALHLQITASFKVFKVLQILFQEELR